MNSKVAKLFSILPISSSIRGMLYKFFSHGQIGKKFKIGFGSYIDSRKIEIGDNASIGNMVRVKLLDRFKMGNGSSIGSSTIICGAYDFNKFQERQFICGDNVGILCSHYFDVVAPVIIGNDVTIAGKWTQFYTHSFDLVPNRLDGGIRIGNNVYIGAASLINLGVTVCDNVVIQGGCVVNKDIAEPGVYASQTIYKRGDVRCYAELFSDKPSKLLETGITVYSVKGKADEQL
jgi:acetyltransferase-like isoleucine patch superfamily enzyme